MSEIDAIGQYFAAAREAELKEQMFERRARAIAREEIEAAKEPMPKVYVVKTTPINQEGGEANSSLRRNVGEDKSPPAVEAPAAGDAVKGGKVLAGVTLPTNGGFGLTPPAAGEREDHEIRNAAFIGARAATDPAMTALARRLAEALRDLSSWVTSAPLTIRDNANEALAEARKHKLIE